MNDIEHIKNIYNLYYSMPVLRKACDSICTSSPKEYGQYLQNKNELKDDTTSDLER